MQLHFLPPLNGPNNPNIFIFFETRTQYKVAGKKSKKSDMSKGVYETTKNSSVGDHDRITIMINFLKLETSFFFLIMIGFDHDPNDHDL
jgi:hypothetical protein